VERLMPSLSYTLRETNSRLSFWLANMVAEAGQPASITPESMAALLSELLRAGASLRIDPVPAKGHDPELEAEVATYFNYVEQLRKLLPEIHRHLLAERAQLESQRTRMRFAAEWARASRQTL
jgi:hypothetical protein